MVNYMVNKFEFSNDKKRSNIYIQDEDLWNWAKYRSKNLGYSSVSDYIFEIIKNEKEKNILDHSILLNLEKYFELNYFTLDEVATRTNTTLEYIDNFLIKNNITLKDKTKAISRVHNLLIENNLSPRELNLFYKLNNYLKYKDDFPNKRDLLLLFYTNEYDRRNEIFSESFDLTNKILEILETKIEKKPNYINNNNNNNNLNKKLLNIPNFNERELFLLFYDLGIDYEDEKETIEEDENFIELKEKNLEHYYYFAFQVSGWIILTRDLFRIFSFFITNSFEIIRIAITKIFKIISNVKNEISHSIINEPNELQELIDNSIVIPPQFDFLSIFDNNSNASVSVEI